MTAGVARVAGLRESLAQGRFINAPGVFDPYSARIVEKLGFPAIYLGGNALGLHLGIGQPFVTLTDTTDAVQKIRRVVQLPIIVDAGAGFGDAAHAALAMRALESSGAASVHLDDQIYPKRAHYHHGMGHLAETEIVCSKLCAMASARSGEGPLLIARTDALRVTKSVDETISRCRDYLAAGADALMVLDLGPDGTAPFRQAFPRTPLVWIGGIVAPAPTEAEIIKSGIAIAVYPFNTIGAVTEAILATWKDFAETGRPASLQRPAAKLVTEALDLIGLEQSLEIERRTTEAGSSRV
jgi:2-methylisocitrate lyase-like PEP mutase family enzyme